MIAEKSKTMIDVEINTEVLVIGAGGLEVAGEIAGMGYAVLFIDNQETSDHGLEAPGGVEVMTGTRLTYLAGIPGDFKVVLEGSGGISERKFGALVVAPVYDKEVLNDAYGLSLDERVISLSRMEAMLEDDAAKGQLENGLSVAFLSGCAQEGNPAETRRVLEAARAVQNLGAGCTYVYAGNVKVAGKGLERLFTQGRHDGVICVKPDGMPAIEQTSEGITISTVDPVVRKDVVFNPDLLVVDEKDAPAQRDLDLAKILRIDTDLDGFLPSNNVHRFPVCSNRQGIFVTGALGSDANVALRVRELLGNGLRSVAGDQAVVDENRCAICLTCYRCCPHGAIYWENGVAVISPLACQGCGICASECPMDAIQIGEFTDDSLNQGVKDAMASVKDAPSIVAFCCQNSALEAGTAARAFGLDLPKGFRMVQVPCAGKVDVEFIMKAFVEGADGVMVAACHEGNCKAERGNIYAKWRVEEIHQRLEKIGLNPDRLVFTTIASNMAEEFAGKVREFAEAL